MIDWTKEPEQTALRQLFKHEWFTSQPAHIQEAIRKHPPTKLYRIKQSKQWVTIVGYDEGADGLVDFRVRIAWQFNQLQPTQFEVMGVKPHHLEVMAYLGDIDANPKKYCASCNQDADVRFLCDDCAKALAPVVLEERQKVVNDLAPETREALKLTPKPLTPARGN